jgi:hypothetical protein
MIASRGISIISGTRKSENVKACNARDAPHPGHHEEQSAAVASRRVTVETVLSCSEVST